MNLKVKSSSRVKKGILSLLTVFIFQFAFGQIPSGYYDNAIGLSGEQLKSVLHNIIKAHNDYPYSSNSTDIWDILEQTDQDPNNPENVILLYTGRSVNAAQEYNNGVGWNREHVWAKSHGFPEETDYAYRDAHHLRPTDISVNEDRGNLDFDEGGTQHSEATGCFYDSDSWEPRDAVKGDIARMMFYMVVRYEGDGDANDNYDLELVDYVGTSETNFGKLSTLLKWHNDDPVDDIDRHRNEIVFSYQNNRNPFIDHPEYVASIWGGEVINSTSDILSLKNNIKIYPNPVNDILTLDFSSEYQNVTVTIYNMIGVVVRQESFNEVKGEVKLNQLNNLEGIYLLQIKTNDKQLIKKIVINN